MFAAAKKKLSDMRTLRAPKLPRSPLLSFANLSLAFVLLCCALIGTFEQYEVYFSLAILAVIVLNWNKDEFYLYLGIFILFQGLQCLIQIILCNSERNVFCSSSSY